MRGSGRPAPDVHRSSCLSSSRETEARDREVSGTIYPPFAKLVVAGKKSERTHLPSICPICPPCFCIAATGSSRARSRGGLVHLVDGCRGDAEFGGDRGDRLLGDVEVDPTVGGEVRADVALEVTLGF